MTKQWNYAANKIETIQQVCESHSNCLLESEVMRAQSSATVLGLRVMQCTASLLVARQLWYAS